MISRVTVNENACKGCDLCANVCAKGSIALNREKFNEKGYNPAAIINAQNCNACAMCAFICPDSAIKVEKELK